MGDPQRTRAREIPDVALHGAPARVAVIRLGVACCWPAVTLGMLPWRRPLRHAFGTRDRTALRGPWGRRAGCDDEMDVLLYPHHAKGNGHAERNSSR